MCASAKNSPELRGVQTSSPWFTKGRGRRCPAAATAPQTQRASDRKDTTPFFISSLTLSLSVHSIQRRKTPPASENVSSIRSPPSGSRGFHLQAPVMHRRAKTSCLAGFHGALFPRRSMESHGQHAGTMMNVLGRRVVTVFGSSPAGRTRGPGPGPGPGPASRWARAVRAAPRPAT